MTDTQPEQTDQTPELLELPFIERTGVTAEQHDFLLMNLNSTRVAAREQGGKTLHYLESWDVRAHLIRVFGFGNFDAEVLTADHVFTRDYMSGGDHPKPMQEIAYKVVLRLVIRAANGTEIARYTEAAVGSASGGSGFGDLHDNAVKQAASDALKRCAINLGTQFGLSLYNDGTRAEIVRVTLVRPPGATRGAPPAKPGADLSTEQAKVLQDSLGATVVSDEPAQGQPAASQPAFTNTANTAAEAGAAVRDMDAKRKAAKR